MGKFSKKFIGTSSLLLLAAAVLFAYSGTARALYRYIGSDLRTDGNVVSVGASSLELNTSGSTWPLTIIVDGSTSFAGGYSALSDVQPGDEVRVLANRDTGDFLASEVSKMPDPASYGNVPCDSFVISTATFERPVNDTLYVQKDGIGVRIQINQDTQVEGGTMEDVVPGTQIIVSGYDCRADGTLTAQTIQIVQNEALAMCNEFGPDSIVVRNYSVLLAHNQESMYSPMLPAAVPAGAYDVYGVSYDNHEQSPWDQSINERWKVHGYTGDSQNYVSMATDDLPDGVDFNQTMIGSDVQILQALDSVQLVHAAPVGSGYESVYPVCVAFVPR
ncbi:hypothetical protein CR970_03075 [Candidatus Saccharibacteria bacterium]|nr:MAG: hypothetical protein CR970_03075 [Candidatus Saccharibacteria bacterium]